jgi:predicted RNase H-like HicB family nuclease
MVYDILARDGRQLLVAYRITVAEVQPSLAVGRVELEIRQLSALDPRQTADTIFSMRQVIIYPGEDGFWVAECPSLPGCVSQGENREQAIQNIREAIEGYILALQEDKLPVPEEHFEALLLAV